MESFVVSTARYAMRLIQQILKIIWETRENVLLFLLL